MNKLEKEFIEQIKLHGDKVVSAYEKAVALSEKYGIPFSAYIPKSFEKYRGHVDPDDEVEYIEGVGPRFINRHCAMDGGWLSSTVECEFNNGEY